jgi:FAD:protein FMN transferase
MTTTMHGAPAATDRAPTGLPNVTMIRRGALGTDVVMAVTEAELAADAEAVLGRELDDIDRACSRFRPDAEIAELHRSGGRWVKVSPLLFEALAVARHVAEETAGAVDPTVGTAMERLGYDRDFRAVAPDGPPTPAPEPAPGWWTVELDEVGRRARVPAGVRLDLGSSAKALVADRIAADVAELGAGVVVSVGGDVSIAGPAPFPAWSVGIAPDSASNAAVEEVVSMTEGGLATSSTELRSWVRGARRVHHILDPRTGDSALAVWRTVTVAASSCVRANAASTAAVVWGFEAPDRLEAMGLAARLVAHDGVVVTTPGWPTR